MKKLLLFLGGLLLVSLQGAIAQSPNKCGMDIIRQAMIAKDPSWKQRFDEQRDALQGIADAYKSRSEADRLAGKTTAAAVVPVIFHVLVTQGEYDTLGGNAGIARRIDSQIAVLNRDFNKGNSDSSLIPAGWKSRYANAGIQFGLAHTDPNGFGTPGFEINLIPNSPGGFSGATNSYSEVKHAISGGFDAWDITRYMNVWVTNFTDIDGLLGLTVPHSFTTGYGYPNDEIGICINWATLGKRVSPSDYYIPGSTPGDYFDQGRTLTHETGHLFEIWHTWGDDNGSCPWQTPFKDDGLADTPPEAGPKFDNTPYSITNGTYYDTCRYDGSVDTQTVLFGVPCLDFMNYTDDAGMHLFTTDQVSVMDAMVLSSPGIGNGLNGSGIIGESHGLIQNPGLLNWSALTGTATIEAGLSLAVSPNPTNGWLHISWDGTGSRLMNIEVMNMLGQRMRYAYDLSGAADYYSIDLSALSKGIYLVRCNFASGSVTRKILLQ